MSHILDNVTELPTLGKGVKIDLGNHYWHTLNIYYSIGEYMFSIKGINGADKITCYKSFKRGINSTRKFLIKFRQ